jgi:hypothetical protein
MIKNQDKTMQNDHGPYNNLEAGRASLIFGKDKVQKKKTVIECEVLEEIIAQNSGIQGIVEYFSRKTQYKVIYKIGQHGQKGKTKQIKKKAALTGVGVVFSRIVNTYKDDKYD